MSKKTKNTNTNNTGKTGKKSETGKVRFFQINKDKDKVAPVLPEDKKGEMPELTNTQARRHEPEFMSLDADSPPDSDFGNSIRAELDELQGQIDDISSGDEAAMLSGKQSDVLKKYLELKELEVRDLKDQHRQYKSYVKKLSNQLDQAHAKNKDLAAKMDDVRRKEEAIRANYMDLKSRHESEIESLRHEFEDRLNESENREQKFLSLSSAKEEWKQKIKEELKRIRLKEQELENKYDLLKRDMQALLDSKDKHVLELKKKSDNLELELESMEERARHSDMILSAIGAKKNRLIDTLKLAINLLEAIDREEGGSDSDDSKKAS